MCIFLLGKFWPRQKLYGKNTLIVRCLSPVIFSRWIIRHFSLFCCVGWLFVLVARSIVGYLVHRLFPFAKSEEKLIEIAVCFIDKQTHTHTHTIHTLTQRQIRSMLVNLTTNSCLRPNTFYYAIHMHKYTLIHTFTHLLIHLYIYLYSNTYK